MKKKLIIIVLIAIMVIVVSASVFFLTIKHRTEDPSRPSECGTTLQVLSTDVTKFDASEIKQAVIEKFPEIDVSNAGVRGAWWDFVKIREPNNEGAFHIAMPGTFVEGTQQYSEVVEILENLEQISDVTVAGLECN